MSCASSLEIEENKEIKDRLSDLPDGVLLHILSFLNSKYIVQTSVLSKRWKYVWKDVPNLMLHASEFSTVNQFSKFVSHILNLHNSSTSLRAIHLDHPGKIETPLLEMILNYVCSHNTHIRELAISVRGDSDLILSRISSCWALTSLKLSIYTGGFYNFSSTSFPTSLNLPALTNSDLTNFSFGGDRKGCVEPFVAFGRLNSLSIRECTLRDAQILKISSDTLINLAIHRPSRIQNNPSDFAKIDLSTPNLSTFTFIGTLDQKLCGTGLSSVKQVHIAAKVHSKWLDLTDHEEPPMVLLSWLLDLTNVKSATFSSTTLQILSLVPDLFEVKFPSLRNLKSIKIHLVPLEDQLGLPYIVRDFMLKNAAAKSLEETAKLRKKFEIGLKIPLIPDRILNFLLQNSPSTKIDITSTVPGCRIYRRREDYQL